jgi:F-type H+-transporting ATPase subunit epsilon
MQLVILSPDKKFFEGNIQTSKFPGDLGQFQVLKGHAPIVSTLKSGFITYRDLSNTDHKLKIKNGFVEVINNSIVALIKE